MPHDSRERPVAPEAAGWPCQSSLRLAALPTAVPCARLHAKHICREWGLDVLAEPAELIVSELVTNAVTASVAGTRPDQDRPLGLPVIRLRLASDGRQVLVAVWDGSPEPPVARDAGPGAVSGRGLLLVQAFSDDWGYCFPRSEGGRAREAKVVWAIAGKA